jgi:hypothetical protein
MIHEVRIALWVIVTAFAFLLAIGVGYWLIRIIVEVMYYVVCEWIDKRKKR